MVVGVRMAKGHATPHNRWGNTNADFLRPEVLGGQPPAPRYRDWSIASSHIFTPRPSLMKIDPTMSVSSAIPIG